MPGERSTLILIEKVSLDKLCLSHFLDAAQRIIDEQDTVRNLNARAQGEIAIREAVQEVSVWSQETVFTLTEHDENGRQTPLIKDWKDLTTQLSDLQARLLPFTLTAHPNPEARSHHSEGSV